MKPTVGRIVHYHLRRPPSMPGDGDLKTLPAIIVSLTKAKEYDTFARWSGRKEIPFTDKPRVVDTNGTYRETGKAR